MSPIDARHEIEAVLDELADLARSDIASAELHSRVLERLVGLLAAAGGVIWSLEDGGPPSIACQLQLDPALAGDPQELARHQKLAEAVAASGQPRLAPPVLGDGQAAKASPWLAILCPVLVEGRPKLVVDIFQRPDGRSAVEEGYLRLVRTACELLEEHHRARALAGLRERHDELREILEYIQQIDRRLELPPVAATIANEARRLLECDRVTVLSWAGRRPRVEAISGAESFDRRSGVVQTLVPLARSVLLVGEPFWHPSDGAELPPEEEAALQAFLDESHARGLALVPLRAASAEEGPPVGLLCLERFGGELDEVVRRRCAGIAQATAAALARAVDYDRIPLRVFLQWLAAVLGLGPGRRWSPVATAAAVLLACAVALCVIPAELTIEARGQLWPVRRQHVFAPSDSTVIDLPLDDGANVAKGDLLARLHSPQLDIEQTEILGKQRTVQESLVAAETEALRSELDGGLPQSRSQLTARVEQLKEELRGLEAQAEILRRQQAALDVKSPLEGIVITWDVQRQLAGRPVKRGDALLTVADLSGPWELVLEVPDHRAGHVLAADRQHPDLPVTFQLGTDPGRVRRGTVTFVSPATELSPQSEPAVRVTASLADAPPAQLRPGATLVARLHCGRRSLAYVWLHELWEAARLRLFW